ncbi:MAG: hypothetical protein ABF290_15240 [Thiogranum sp.]
MSDTGVDGIDAALVVYQKDVLNLATTQTFPCDACWFVGPYLQ